MVDIKIGKFDIHRSILNSIAYACQDREFAEEVDLLEKYGGYSWIEVIYNCFYKIKQKTLEWPED